MQIVRSLEGQNSAEPNLDSFNSGDDNDYDQDPSGPRAGCRRGGCPATAQEFFRIGTGGAGGTYFPIGGAIATAISNPPGSRPCDEGGNVASKG